MNRSTKYLRLNFVCAQILMTLMARAGGDSLPAGASTSRAWGDIAGVQGWWTGTEGRVVWQFRDAWGVAGLNVYRLDEASGGPTRLNAELIPIQFYTVNASYGVTDPLAVENGTGTYRFEGMDFSGNRIELGDYPVEFTAGPMPGTEGRASRTVLPVKRTSLPEAPAVSSVLKVQFSEEGIYGVGLTAIATAMGCSLAEVEMRAATNGLKITRQNEAVPYVYDVPHLRLVFFGNPSTNWYTRTAAYMIQAGAGVAMPRREPNATAGAAVFPVRFRSEQDAYPFDGAVLRPADYYYWNYIVSTTNPASNRVNFAVNLDGYETGALTLQVDLQGWSKTSTQNPDHHAEFWLNGTYAGAISFDDQNAATAVLDIPAGVASNGINQLTVRGALTNASNYSYFILDGVTAEYSRKLAPRLDGGTVIIGGAAAPVSAALFQEPIALALDEAGNATWIANGGGELPDKAWAAASTNERFAVIEADGIPELQPQPVVADAWFLAATNRIDYLVLTSRGLAPAAQALVEYRASQGLRAGLAVFEDVCDVMAGGLRTPEAIPVLLRYAATNWAESPQMVVLAGNGHYDYLNAFNTETNPLPPLLYQASDGLYAADGLLADAGGDELPDVAIGRLPALTTNDLADMIAKIQAYEAASGASWQSQLVFTADKADAAGNFSASVTRFTNLVQNPWTVSNRIDLDTMAITPARSALLAGFNAGAGMIHYSGHGYATKWNSSGLLTTTDANGLANARQPVVVSLCCLAGHFEAPAVSSLAEALMQRAAGGAVAVWASSGLPLNAPATDMGAAFYSNVFQQGAGRLGRAILLARRSLPGDIFTRDTFATYNLLGDPALQIAGGMVNPTNLPAQIFLNGLDQTFAGTPRYATATTMPAGLTVKMTYAGQVSAPTAAGEYAVTATVATAYYSGLATGVLTVAQATASVILGQFNQTYDGFPKTVTAVTVPAGLEVEYTYNGSPVAPTAAGTYIVTGRVDDANWQGIATGTLRVAKAVAAVALTHLNQTYDGETRTATVTTVPDGLPTSITYNGSEVPPVAVGQYAVTASVVAANFTGDATGTLVVAKAAASVQLRDLAQTYDGTPRVVTATTVPDELAVDIRYNGQENAPSSAGNYAVSATINDPNWQGSATGILEVAKAGQTIDFPAIGGQWTTNLVALSATASSGLPVAFTVLFGPGVITNGTILGFTGTGTVAVAATQSGSANWAAASEVVRTLAVSYSLPIPEFSVENIGVREGGEGRLHIRLRSKPSSSVVVSMARVSGCTNISIKSGAALTFKPANWDTYQVVTLVAAQDTNAQNEAATFRVSGAGLSDVNLTAQSLDDDLGQNWALASGGATITGTLASNVSMAIDGVHTSSVNCGYTIWTSAVPGTMTLDLKSTVTVSRMRLLNYDWAQRRQNYRLEGSRDGGNWTTIVDASTGIHVGWEEWTSGGSARYLRFTGLSNSANSSVGIAEWEVYGTPWSRTPAEVSLDNLNQVYDGSSKHVRAITVPAGLETGITYNGSPAAPIAAGSYTAVVTVTDANYSGGATGVMVVAKGVANIFLGGLVQTYDGSSKVAAVTTVPAGLTVACTYDGSASGPVNAGSYALSGVIADPNYQGTASGTFTIVKAAAAVELMNLNAVYDGTAKPVLVTTEPEGLVVAVTYNGAGTVPAAAGVYAVSAAVDDENYAGVAEDTLAIARADQTIDFLNPGDQWSTNVLVLSATASSGQPVDFSVQSGPAIIRGGNLLTFTGGGLVSIVAVQAGDGNWNAAPTLTNTFLVNAKTAPVVCDTSINVREGGEGRFFVRLNQDPGRNVVVTVARTGGDNGVTIQSGGVRTFDSTCWNDWQAVTLAATTDEDADNETATFQVSLPDGGEQVVTATVLDDDIGSNLALASGGSTMAGTPELSSRAGQLIDGVHNVSTNYGYTIWTNDSKGALTLDLQAPATVSRIRLLNWDWVFRAHRYTLESSVDGANWTMLRDASGEEHTGWDDWPLDNVQLRYLRFTGISNTYNQCVLVSELEVYGTRSLVLPSPVLLKTNVNVREGGEGRFFVRLNQAPEHGVAVNISRSSGATNLTIQSGSVRTFDASCWDTWQAVTLAAPQDGNADAETAMFVVSMAGVADQQVTATTLDDDISENLALASSGATATKSNGSQPGAVIDGWYNYSTNYGYTIWTNLAAPGFITVDLKTTAVVSRVRVLGWDWVCRVQRYRLESSLDGTNWTLLADASSEDHAGWDDWPVATQAMRYVRFTGLYSSYNQCVLASELEVYGLRPVARRALPVADSVRETRMALAEDGAPFPLTVVTSHDGPAHTNGWAAIDGDSQTWWADAAGGGGGYIAIGYDATVYATNVVVELAEESAVPAEFYLSLDGREWTAWTADPRQGPVAFNYLWLVFRNEGGTGPGPRVAEIRIER